MTTARPGRTPLTPPGAERRRIRTTAGDLGVLHAGSPRPDVPPVVLVHGGGTDSAAISWYLLFEPLSATHEVWAVDLPGFGSSVEREAVGGPEPLAEVLAEAMHALGLPPAVVCGVSMGGDVAMNLALSEPELVSALVLVAPGGLTRTVGSPRLQYAAWMAAQLPDRILLPAGRFANRFVRTALKRLVADPATLPPDVVNEFVRLARHPQGVPGYARYNQATLGRDGMLNDLTERVHLITVPTLFVHGAQDPIVSPEDSRRASGLMPDAELVILPGTGHLAQLERPEEFLSALLDFLGRKADPAGSHSR